jgi:hypothetical protein
MPTDATTEHRHLYSSPHSMHVPPACITQGTAATVDEGIDPERTITVLQAGTAPHDTGEAISQQGQDAHVEQEQGGEQEAQPLQLRARQPLTTKVRFQSCEVLTIMDHTHNADISHANNYHPTTCTPQSKSRAASKTYRQTSTPARKRRKHQVRVTRSRRRDRCV